MEKWRRVRGLISKTTRAQSHASARAPTLTYRHTHTYAHMHALTHVFHTDTHAQKYVILIYFLGQQCFHERASMLPCTYIARLVNFLDLKVYNQLKMLILNTLISIK